MNSKTDQQPPQKNIDTLRERCFDTIDRLLDKENPIDVSRAKAVAEIATVIVESAKAETALIATLGAREGSGFIPYEKPAPPALLPDPKKPGANR